MMTNVNNRDSYLDTAYILSNGSTPLIAKLAGRLDWYGNGVYTITTDCAQIAADSMGICRTSSSFKFAVSNVWQGFLGISNDVKLVVLAAFVIGFGLAMLVAPLTSVVLSSLPAKNAGVGTAINYVAAKVAGLFAVAGLGLVFSSVFTADLDAKLVQISPDPSLKAKLEAFKSNLMARAESGLPLVRGAQTEAFKVVMLVCAGLTLVGGVAALFVEDPKPRDLN